MFRCPLQSHRLCFGPHRRCTPQHLYAPETSRQVLAVLDRDGQSATDSGVVGGAPRITESPSEWATIIRKTHSDTGPIRERGTSTNRLIF